MRPINTSRRVINKPTAYPAYLNLLLSPTCSLTSHYSHFIGWWMSLPFLNTFCSRASSRPPWARGDWRRSVRHARCSSVKWTRCLCLLPAQARVVLHLLWDELGFALGDPQRQLPVPSLLLQDGLSRRLLLPLHLQLHLHLHLNTHANTNEHRVFHFAVKMHTWSVCR